MPNMTRKEEVKEIIKRVWRVQFKAIGDSSIEQLYEAVQAKKPLDELLNSAEGGSSFDLHSTWQLLYEAVDLTANALALYTLWKQRNERSPSKKEMLQLLREAKIENSYSRAVLERLDILIDQIAKQDND
jgi:hypothetical protein